MCGISECPRFKHSPESRAIEQSPARRRARASHVPNYTSRLSVTSTRRSSVFVRIVNRNRLPGFERNSR